MTDEKNNPEEEMRQAMLDIFGRRVKKVSVEFEKDEEDDETKRFMEPTWRTNIHDYGYF